MYVFTSSDLRNTVQVSATTAVVWTVVIAVLCFILNIKQCIVSFQANVEHHTCDFHLSEKCAKFKN